MTLLADRVRPSHIATRLALSRNLTSITGCGATSRPGWAACCTMHPHPGRAVVWGITRARIRRGTFESVPVLVAAIDDYLQHYNEGPAAVHSGPRVPTPSWAKLTGV